MLLPSILIVTWLALAGVGGPYFGKIGEVSSNDLADFLPERAESTKVDQELRKFQESSTVPLIAALYSGDRLTAAERQVGAELADRLASTEYVADALPPPVISDDEKAQLLTIPLDSSVEVDESIEGIRDVIDEASGELDYALTGPAMFSRDLIEAFAGIDGTLLIVALSVVFVILLGVYRSPILPIVTLTGSLSALAVAVLAVWYLADADIVRINGQVQGILFILVIGAATDYSLLYIARYREELLRHRSAWQATVRTWRASVEPIVAAGGTVVLGLLCLLASDLGSNQALGPVGSVGISLAILSSLTFLPAALLLLGRLAFWPKPPKYVSSKARFEDVSSHSVWSRVANLVGRHPRRVWMSVVAVLVLASFGLPQLKAEGVSQADLIFGYSEARDGQAVLEEHFPGGSGTPLYVLAPQDLLDEAVEALDAESAIDGLALLSTDSDRPQLPVGEAADEIRRQLPPHVDPFAGVQERVINDRIMLSATLSDPATSDEAKQTVERIRQDLSRSSSSMLVGGQAAIQLDTNHAASRDIRVVIPLILVSITIVLMLLLRSVVAPLMLMAFNVLSFTATLGIAAVLFNHVWGFPGADPSVVIFGFVFLIALGIDYTIFLMTRVREETKKLGVRVGTLRGLVVTGGVITSAGVVLAATFGALYVIPILFLAQLAFIVAFGVLLDTLVVRSLLAPSMTLEIGRKVWWPSKLSRSGTAKR